MYRDAARPTSERVEDLLERMTLPEKLAQLGAVWGAELLAPAGDGTGPVSFSADAARERVPEGARVELDRQPEGVEATVTMEVPVLKLGVVEVSAHAWAAYEPGVGP